MKPEKLYNRRDALKKIGIVIGATSSPLFLLNCANIYSLSRQATKSQITSFLISTPHTFYANKEKGLIVGDKNGGIEFKADSGWEKISQDKINLSDSTRTTNYLSIKNRETGTDTYQGFISQQPSDETSYELETDLKGNTFEVIKIEKSEGGDGGGGG